MKDRLPGDEFRTAEQAMLPDVRSPMFGLHSIEQHRQKIEQYSLHPEVSESIHIQFDVAKNLFLYAYHVFRFYMVAQHQAYITLELAIRDKIGKEELARYAKESHMSKGLRAYMKYLHDRGIIKNDDFPTWHNRRRVNAYSKNIYDTVGRMSEEGLTSIALDEDLDIEKYPFDYDYVETLCRSIPSIRNEHAHGSEMLFHQVSGAFENVSIIINRLYAPTY